MHFSPDMIMAALRRGLLVVEVPITFWPRVGVSKEARARACAKRAEIGLSMLWHIAAYPTRAAAGTGLHGRTGSDRRTAGGGVRDPLPGQPRLDASGSVGRRRLRHVRLRAVPGAARARRDDRGGAVSGQHAVGRRRRR